MHFTYCNKVNEPQNCCKTKAKIKNYRFCKICTFNSSDELVEL